MLTFELSDPLLTIELLGKATNGLSMSIYPRSCSSRGYQSSFDTLTANGRALPRGLRAAATLENVQVQSAAGRVDPNLDSSSPAFTPPSTRENSIMEAGSTSEGAATSSTQPVANATQPDPSFRVWRPPRASGTASSQPRDLPDSFFEVTAMDVMMLQHSRTAERERLVDGPLRTSVMRDRDERQREAKYPMTKIRVKFPDQTQLERVFPSTDKIRSVYAFVRNSLREDVKPIKFVLYQTPPRRELKVSDPNVREKTLLQLQLAPSSVLMLSFFDESLNHNTVPAPLAESVLQMAQDLPPPPVFNEPRSQNPGSSTAGSVAASLEQKLPKWLKLSSKRHFILQCKV
ncbi:hypothetical protein FRC17_005803 [Serendipita sp. 399]|nr:hypothetical protein FRC17_005803 [Serendipita sp. 399]